MHCMFEKSSYWIMGFKNGYFNSNCSVDCFKILDDTDPSRHEQTYEIDRSLALVLFSVLWCVCGRAGCLYVQQCCSIDPVVVDIRQFSHPIRAQALLSSLRPTETCLQDGLYPSPHAELCPTCPPTFFLQSFSLTTDVSLCHSVF